MDELHARMAGSVYCAEERTVVVLQERGGQRFRLSRSNEPIQGDGQGKRMEFMLCFFFLYFLFAYLQLIVYMYSFLCSSDCIYTIFPCGSDVIQGVEICADFVLDKKPFRLIKLFEI